MEINDFGAENISSVHTSKQNVIETPKVEVLSEEDALSPILRKEMDVQIFDSIVDLGRSKSKLQSPIGSKI